MTTIPVPDRPEAAPEVPAPVMSEADLAGLGLAQVAYVRPDRAGAWAIHAADGTRIGTAPNRPLAFAALRQHGLEPLDVH